MKSHPFPPTFREDHLELCHSRKRGNSRCSARSAAINLWRWRKTWLLRGSLKGFRFLKKSIHCSSASTFFMMSDVLCEKGFINFTRTPLALYNSTMIHKFYITLSFTQPPSFPYSQLRVTLLRDSFPSENPAAHPLASQGKKSPVLSADLPPGRRWKSHLARSRRCPQRSGEVWCGTT